MRKQRRGLTLIEITIVILALGIVAAVTMPRLSVAVQATQLRQAAIVLQSHIAHARATALNTGRPVTLDFDNATDSYSSDSVQSPEKPGTWLAVSLLDQFGVDIDLTADFDQSSTLEFDPEGVPRVGGNRVTNSSIELRLGDRVQQIVIMPATGLAVLDDGIGT